MSLHLVHLPSLVGPLGTSMSQRCWQCGNSNLESMSLFMRASVRAKILFAIRYNEGHEPPLRVRPALTIGCKVTGIATLRRQRSEGTCESDDFEEERAFVVCLRASQLPKPRIARSWRVTCQQSWSNASRGQRHSERFVKASRSILASGGDPSSLPSITA